MTFHAAPFSAPGNPRRRSLLARLLTAAGLLFLLTMPLRAGSVEDLDRDNGLPEAKLGTPLKSFKGLELVEDTGRWLTYKIPGDNLKYLGNDVVSIKFNFFKEELYSIDVTFTSKGTGKRLLKTLEQNYGKNHSFETRKITEENMDMETREWVGNKVYLLLKTAGDFRGGTVVFVNKPVWDQLAKPREEHAAEMKKKLDGSYINADF